MKNILYISLIIIFGSIDSHGQLCVGEDGSVTWECWRNLYDDEIGEMKALEFYPENAEISQTIFRIQAPNNYDDYFGGTIRGFIKVTKPGVSTFNITANRRAEFYLSADSTAANLSLIASAPDWTNVEEHDKYSEQTSVGINLVEDVHYYFELRYVDSSGGDHAAVYWKTPDVDLLNWNVITADFLNDVACLDAICPPRGEVCDDGDPTTSNDQQDGHCHCYGAKETTNSCIGEQGKITSYRYDSIPGNYLSGLYMDPDFPAMPNTSSRLDLLGTRRYTRQDSIGHMVQGFIRVPVSGNYKFNITGDNECIFFLSSDETEANKQAHQALVSSWTYMVEHDKYIYQSTANIYLDENQYYFYEVNHKEGSYAEHYSIFWQTPFTQTDTWKRIPSIYLYDYTCTLACVSQGTPCNDGDPFTNNDEYNASCECVGTPCLPPNCDDPVANYIPYPKCHVTDQLDNRQDNNWLSCNIQSNPNSLRADSHWIHYELDQNYKLLTSQIWNYNEAGATDQGFEMVAVDISDDGINWTEIGVFNWPLASGDENYSGFMGPDFGGFQAQHVLFTCLDASPPCKGLGKVAFNAVVCPELGTICDDGDPLTIGDKYDNDCNCFGLSITENQCNVDTLLLGDTLIYSDNYSAIEYVESMNIVDTSIILSLIGGEEVSLDIGFDAPANSDLWVLIDTCGVGAKVKLIDPPMLLEERMKAETDILKVISKEGTDDHIIQFKLEKPELIQLEIHDANGRFITSLANYKYDNKGIYFKRIRTKKLDAGVYTVTLKSATIDEKERLIVK